MGYAFISYSTKKQSSADAMKKLLNDNQIETWMAPDSIQPGSAYPGQIKLAIENCSCLVLLLSDMAQNSVWVSKEVERAINYHKTIIPIQIEDVNLNDDFEMYLNTCQIRTIPIIEASANGMDEIVATVKALTGTTYKKPPSREKTEPEPVPKPKPPVPQKEDYGQRNVPSRKDPPIRVDNIFSSPKRKRKVSGKLIGGLIAATLAVALFAFVIWPKLIYPHLSDDDLYTPGIVQTYCYSDRYGDDIFTITECSEDGHVNAVWEMVRYDTYYKGSLGGKIVDKKNNGDVVIEWTSKTAEIYPEGIWPGETRTRISKNSTVLKTDTLSTNTLKAGQTPGHVIVSAEDFLKLAESDGTFLLKNDIDLTGINWTPINGFRGTLLGNGFTISNLTYYFSSTSNNVGFFSVLAGEVKNLRFENAQITVSGDCENIGILCGSMTNNGARGIFDVSVSGKVTAEKGTNVGGIAGFIDVWDNDLSRLTNLASVTGAENVGGIAGYLMNSESWAHIRFTDIRNEGSVTASGSSAGGIFGRYDGDNPSEINLSDCSNAGNIKGDRLTGGLIGCIGANVKTFEMSGAENSGSISGTEYVGGLVGFCKSESVRGTGLLSGCRNDGSVTASGSYVGGAFGYFSGEKPEIRITDFITGGNITGKTYVGGACGYCGGKYSNIWIKETTYSGTITGESCVGGVFGYLYARVEELSISSSSTGSVIGSSDTDIFAGKLEQAE